MGPSLGLKCTIVLKTTHYMFKCQTMRRLYFLCVVSRVQEPKNPSNSLKKRVDWLFSLIITQFIMRSNTRLFNFMLSLTKAPGVSLLAEPAAGSVWKLIIRVFITVRIFMVFFQKTDRRRNTLCDRQLLYSSDQMV